MKITVRAKITAGVHPEHGPIVEGQEYRIEEHQMADELFELVGDDNQPPAPSGKKRR